MRFKVGDKVRLMNKEVYALIKDKGKPHCNWGRESITINRIESPLYYDECNVPWYDDECLMGIDYSVGEQLFMWDVDHTNGKYRTFLGYCPNGLIMDTEGFKWRHAERAELATFVHGDKLEVGDEVVLFDYFIWRRVNPDAETTVWTLAKGKVTKIELGLVGINGCTFPLSAIRGINFPIGDKVQVSHDKLEWHERDFLSYDVYGNPQTIWCKDNYMTWKSIKGKKA